MPQVSAFSAGPSQLPKADRNRPLSESNPALNSANVYPRTRIRERAASASTVDENDRIISPVPVPLSSVLATTLDSQALHIQTQDLINSIPKSISLWTEQASNGNIVLAAGSDSDIAAAPHSAPADNAKSPARKYSWRNPRPRISSRRASLRSENSEPASPASAFLALFNGPVVKPSPVPDDDEGGQEVGDYVIGKVIGYGGFSTVREAIAVQNAVPVTRAVKILKKTPNNEQAQADLEHELSIWKFVQPPHPHILELISVHEENEATYCFMQHANMGSVFDAIIRRRRQSVEATPVSEATKVRWLWELCTAIEFLHQSLRVVHRDIKLENCLLHVDSPAFQTLEDAHLLLCDFGMAEYIAPTGELAKDTDTQDADNENGGELDAVDSDNELSATSTRLSASVEFDISGSIPYLPPEVLTPAPGLQPVSPRQDIWSLGVFAYALFASKLPFAHTFMPKLQQMIRAGEWDADALLASTSPKLAHQILDFITKCLEMDPEKRWEISDIMNHEMFNEVRHVEEG
ncbi:kinase-like domain-containing protein [Limtongia smithiae]|uniref:kinase-like domain-containing protein n=1 Tax=Limtongia smithiae TaxID=1125753 RepID=UPI0034CF99BA